MNIEHLDPLNQSSSSSIVSSLSEFISAFCHSVLLLIVLAKRSSLSSPQYRMMYCILELYYRIFDVRLRSKFYLYSNNQDAWEREHRYIYIYVCMYTSIYIYIYTWKTIDVVGLRPHPIRVGEGQGVS